MQPDKFLRLGAIGELMSRIPDPPRIEHFGARNPVVPVDTEFIGREWAQACAGDMMTYDGAPGMMSSEYGYKRDYDAVMGKQAGRR